ncbi:MAG: RNA polymerase sigma factor [Terriglobales bacterium]
MTASMFHEIVRRLGNSRSDSEAWKALTQILGPTLLATAYRILRGNLPLAEDATQESFLRLFLYAHFEDFSDNPDAFRSYALVTCRNMSRNYLRQLLQNPEVSCEVDLLEQASSSSQDPESIAVGSSMLAGMVLRLDEDSRELLDLVLQGYTIQEISERLSLTYGNVAVQIHRLRVEIAKWLKKQRQ